MFIIDQYAGEDYQEAFVDASLCEVLSSAWAFPDFRDATLAYCNL